MNSDRWVKLLTLCTSLLLISRGWLIWRFESPIALHLNQVSDSALSPVIGVFLIISGIFIWIKHRRIRLFLLLASSSWLLLDSIARWVGTGYQLGMAIEHSLQMLTPILLVIAHHGQSPRVSWMRIAAIATALTFTGHALYAIGFHTVPDSYLSMTQTLLVVSHGAATTFLSIAGILDLLAAAMIFFRPLQKAGLLYMVIWGAATALARIVSHIPPAESACGLDPWLAETLVRTPHWAVPLLILMLIREKKA